MLPTWFFIYKIINNIISNKYIPQKIKLDILIELHNFGLYSIRILLKYIINKNKHTLIKEHAPKNTKQAKKYTPNTSSVWEIISALRNSPTKTWDKTKPMIVKT